jgi:hypothetical protein
MIGQLRILQEQTSTTPKPFQAVSSSGFSRDVAWSLLMLPKKKKKKIRPSHVVRIMFQVCWEANGFILLSNIQLAVTGELKKIPDEQCITSV